MLNFRKLFITKIISLVVAIVFFIDTSAHGIDLSTRPTLRVPIPSSTEEGQGRLGDVAEEASVPSPAPPSSQGPGITIAPFKRLRGLDWSRFITFSKREADHGANDEDFGKWLKGSKIKPAQQKRAVSLKKAVDDSAPSRIETHIYQQTGKLLNLVLELVDNAIDTTLKTGGHNIPIGQFGEGALQSLSLLDENLTVNGSGYQGDFVTWSSSTQDDAQKARRAIFYKKKGKLKVDFEERDGNYETGTLVQVRSAKLQGRREEVNEYLRRAYEDSDQVMVFLNGELINARTNITEINGHDIDFMVKDRVISINTYDDGFEIRDEGVGMDRATVLTKLPIPRRGTNQETHRRLQDDPKAGARSLLIQDELTDEEHPTMRAVFIVGSRAMDAFEVPSEGAILPRKIRIKFPAFTTLTDAKDSIVMDDVVKTTVDYLIGRLSEATPKNIFPIINGLSHIVRYLQDKDSAGEYNFIDSFVQKITTQVLIPYIEEHNAIFLPSREGLRNLSLDTNREVVYLDEMFFSDDTELLDRCLEDLPFVAGVTGGKAYSLPLAQGEEPVFIYGSTLFIDEKLRAELQDPAVPQEAKALLGAFLDAAQIRGYVVVPEGEDGQNRFTAILGQVSSFQELPGSIQTRILNRLNDTGMEEDVLASLVEAVQDTPAEDAASEVEGALEQETSRISSHTSDLLNLVERLSGSLWAQKGEQVASGIVEGRSCVVMKGEDFKGELRWIVFDVEGDEVLFDSREYEKALNEDEDWKRHHRNKKVVITDIGIKHDEFRVNVTLERKMDFRKIIPFLLVLSLLSLSIVLSEIAHNDLFVVMAFYGSVVYSVYEVMDFAVNSGKPSFYRNLMNIVRSLIFASLLFTTFSYFDAGRLWWPFLSKNTLPFDGTIVPAIVAGTMEIFGLFFVGNILRSRFPVHRRGDLHKVISRTFNIGSDNNLPGSMFIYDPRDKYAAFMDLSTENEYGYLSKSGKDFKLLSSDSSGTYFQNRAKRGKGIRITRRSPGRKKPKREVIATIPKNETLLDTYKDENGLVLLTSHGEQNSVYFYDEETGELEKDSFLSVPGAYSRIIFSKDKKYYILRSAASGLMGLYVYDSETKETETRQWLYDNTAFGSEWIHDGQRYILAQKSGGGDGQEISLHVFDKDTDARVDVGTVAVTDMRIPLAIAETSNNDLIVMGRPREVGEGAQSSWPIGAVKIELSESEDSSATEDVTTEIDLSQRADRLTENLQYVPVKFFDKDRAILLIYIDHKILNKLSPQTLARLEVFIRDNPGEREGVLHFFESLEPILQEQSQAQLNTIVNNWLREYTQESSSDAETFLLALDSEYVIKGERIKGAKLFEDKYFQDAQDFLRGFWLRLKMDKAVQAPQRQDHVLFFEEDVTRKQSEISEAPISLAQLFLTRDMLNREYVGLEDYKTRLGITDHDEPPDETGYNNEINSAITGQDASTFIREAIQNARDATRSAQPHGDTNNTVEVRCYVIPRGPDEYELVTEIQDNGVGMDDHVILNRLLPLDETTKRQHMGQGFYTTWADTRPGDKVEIETSKGNGVGHVLRQSRNTDGEIMVDSLEEVKLFESPRGTSIRQRRYFSTLEEATQQYGKLTERLNFYCGAVSDVNINFNGGQINEDLELGAQVQFGELGVSRFLIGDGHNRITQDELSMPVSLNVVTVRDRYWQAIPSEVQDELLTQGITTDIAPNLLLTKARTEPAYEEYLPFIRRSESLKALLFLSRSVSRISNPDVLLRILEALENADRDNPEVDRMAGYLNFIDEDDYGQRQFHLVSEEDMKENWYQLLVRIEMDVVVEDGSTQRLSLLDMHRLKQDLSIEEEQEIEIEEPFSLPQVQYEESASSKDKAPKTKLPKFLRNTIIWVCIYSMLLPLLYGGGPLVYRAINYIAPYVDRYTRNLPRIDLPFDIKISYPGDWTSTYKATDKDKLFFKVHFDADGAPYRISAYSNATPEKREELFSSGRQEIVMDGRRAIIYFDSSGKITSYSTFDEKLGGKGSVQTREDIEDVLSRARQQEQKKIAPTSDSSLSSWKNNRMTQDDMDKMRNQGSPGENSVLRESGSATSASVLAYTDGLTWGEYAIASYQPYLGYSGPYSARDIKVIPQGEETGGVVTFTYAVSHLKKGDEIAFLQIKDGVPTEIEIDSFDDFFDTSTISDGYITVKESIGGNVIKMRVRIPRRTENNRIEYDPNFDQDWMEEEFKDIPAEWKAMLDPVRGDVPLEQKVATIDKLMRQYFVYDDTVRIMPNGTWMNSAQTLVGEFGEVRGFCHINTIYKQILLRYVGERSVYGHVYVYKGKNIIPSNTSHADNYIVLEDGSVQESRWQVGSVHSVGDYSLDWFEGEVDMATRKEKEAIEEYNRESYGDNYFDFLDRPVMVWFNSSDKPVLVSREDVFPGAKNAAIGGTVEGYNSQTKEALRIEFDASGKVTEFSAIEDVPADKLYQALYARSPSGQDVRVWFTSYGNPTFVTPHFYYNSEEVEGLADQRMKFPQLRNGRSLIIDFDSSGHVTEVSIQEEPVFDGYAKERFDSSGRPLKVWFDHETRKPLFVSRLDVLSPTDEGATPGNLLVYNNHQDYRIEFDSSGNITKAEPGMEWRSFDANSKDFAGREVQVLFNEEGDPVKVEASRDDLGRRQEVSFSGELEARNYQKNTNFLIRFDSSGAITDFVPTPKWASGGNGYKTSSGSNDNIYFDSNGVPVLVKTHKYSEDWTTRLNRVFLGGGAEVHSKKNGRDYSIIYDSFGVVIKAEDITAGNLREALEEAGEIVKEDMSVEELREAFNKTEETETSKKGKEVNDIVVGVAIAVALVAALFLSPVLLRFRQAFRQRRARRQAPKKQGSPESVPGEQAASDQIHLAGALDVLEDIPLAGEDQMGQPSSEITIEPMAPDIEDKARALLTDLIRLISRTDSEINIDFIFGLDDPKLDFSEGVLRINQRDYQDAIEELRTYLSEEGPDRAQLIKSWVAIAFQASYVIAREGQSHVRKDQLNHYLRACYSLIRNFGVIGEVFDSLTTGIRPDMEALVDVEVPVSQESEDAAGPSVIDGVDSARDTRTDM